MATQPAIRRQWSDADDSIETIATVGSDTRFEPGLGELGTRVQQVAHECPRCGHDEMYRGLDLRRSKNGKNLGDGVSDDLYPEGIDSVVYYCASITCPHFVGDELDHDAGLTQRRASEPEVWTNTAVCPDCGDWFSIECSQSPIGDSQSRRSVDEEVNARYTDSYRWEGEPGESKVRQQCDRCMGDD